jgi:biotin carboxyl carrier protein
MRYYVQIDGREEQVEIARQRDDIVADHAGERFHVRAACIEQGTRYSLLVQGRSLDVIVAHDGDLMTLIVNGRGHRVRVEDERERAARRISSSKSAGGHHVVKSPMPGVVRAVQAVEGQIVKKGTALLVLEAMKMENEIAAETDGAIERVHVAPGMAVNQGDALVQIGPPPQGGP